MAGRGPQTFKKRQKEEQRKQRQEEKRQRRLQRKQDGTPETSDSEQSDGELDTDLDAPPEPASSSITTE